MTDFADLGRTILRNKLIGRWGAEKLGLSAKDADAYTGTLVAGSDVFSKIRKDFDAAGVVQSDEQILHVMSDLTIKAGSLMPSTQGGSLDAAAVVLARRLNQP